MEAPPTAGLRTHARARYDDHEAARIQSVSSGCEGQPRASNGQTANCKSFAVLTNSLANTNRRKLPASPCSNSTAKTNARKEFYTSAQIDKIRAAASKEGPEWRCLIELAYALGWRRGELLGLLVSNVDLMAGTVRIDTSKNGEPREAVLTDRLKMFVQPLLGNRAPDDLVFTITESSIRYGWRRIASVAGVPKGIFHSFRRTSARDKRAAGVAASVIMEVAGWKSGSLFRRYAITAREDKLDSQRKLEEYQSRNRTQSGHLEQVSETASGKLQ